MAFFKLQIPGFKSRNEASSPSPAESVDVLRRRARHRLIGAVVLVLIAIVGFPLVFDTQPRPVAIDVPIVIPDRNKVTPLTLPSAPAQATATSAAASLPAVTGPLTQVPAQSSTTASSPRGAARTASAAEGGAGKATVNARASLDAREEIVTTKPATKESIPSVKQPSSAIKQGAPSAATPAAKPSASSATPPADDGRRARALLEGKETPKTAAAAPSAERFIVQIGAFADAGKARETRLKVEKAGLVTYTQVVETPDGKRIRVRVGPYASRAEADKAAARIRTLDLPAAILTL